MNAMWKAVATILFGVAVSAVTAMPANAAEEIVCGRIMGYVTATATAPGSLVIPQPGDVAPAGIYIVIPVGASFTSPGTGWVCVRTSIIAPTQVFGGNTATHSFIEFVAQGAAGYRAEPTAAPTLGTPPSGKGGTGLPNTSTDNRSDLGVAIGFALIAVAAALIMRRSRGSKRT